jgi:hypothetical protein
MEAKPKLLDLLRARIRAKHYGAAGSKRTMRWRARCAHATTNHRPHRVLVRRAARKPQGRARKDGRCVACPGLNGTGPRSTGTVADAEESGGRRQR